VCAARDETAFIFYVGLNLHRKLFNTKFSNLYHFLYSIRYWFSRTFLLFQTKVFFYSTTRLTRMPTALFLLTLPTKPSLSLPRCGSTQRLESRKTKTTRTSSFQSSTLSSMLRRLSKKLSLTISSCS
jgi:hypothetical protein